MKVEIQANSERLKQAIVKRGRAIADAIEDALREIGIEITREAIHEAPISTGALRKSLGFEVTFKGNAGFVESGTLHSKAGRSLRYARIQDFGGVVRPRYAQKLAIPVHPLFKTEAGVGGIRARDVIQNPGAFGFKNIFFRPKSIMGTRIGEKEPEVLFARADSVFITGTRYLSGPFGAMRRGWALDIIRKHIENVVSK